ncbi:hypothetical protein ZIOFF_019468 [Zingiber officinale]|uniref:Reverse transcriptase domain-containing protein n=1 Tax=Zingiber officinale TaxID=94328 RepID=A0A8J5LMY2_ZINOF|nr:hypothetical protein ZIOFF_019468 [Zingiber officinale]
MDNCFKEYEEFLVVYIDDILVFSATEEAHIQHLTKMLDICAKEGLVLSPSKMKIAQPEIEFLGATVGNRKIKLQQHIIRKIIDFDEQKLQTLKGLRSWLEILNYARPYIQNLSTLLGPLYSKTSPNGDPKFKNSDWEIIRKIRKIIQELPDLELPPINSYIIIETDDSMEGWGGICKWKKSKYDSRSIERICAYASGKFPSVKAAIDAEIHACMEALSTMKIHYLDKKEIILRTDCHAIIKFFNKTTQNKPSRVRWISFVDYITGTGVDIQFEHIEGSNNELADALSRLVHYMITIQDIPNNQEELFMIIDAAVDETKDASLFIGPVFTGPHLPAATFTVGHTPASYRTTKHARTERAAAMLAIKAALYEARAARR